MQTNEMADVLCGRIKELLTAKQQLIVAIDGRCAAGKTTLAAQLQKKIDCNVFHMDDFFLRPEQRTQQRLSTPGENVDYERFWKEILLPLINRQAIIYRPYDCHRQAFGLKITQPYRPVTIIEGSYSCHPKLWKYYDLHVFLDVKVEEQISRILARNSDTLNVFRNKWIPLEEMYFSAYEIERRCEIVLR